MDEAERESPEFESAPSKPRWRRRLRTALVALWFALLGLALVAAVLYRFGGMWLPRAEMRVQYEKLVANGSVQPVANRFVIPIPGCVCHSDDPYLTMQHAERRIDECAGCHGAGMGPR